MVIFPWDAHNFLYFRGATKIHKTYRLFHDGVRQSLLTICTWIGTIPGLNCILNGIWFGSASWYGPTTARALTGRPASKATANWLQRETQRPPWKWTIVGTCTDGDNPNIFWSGALVTIPLLMGDAPSSTSRHGVILIDDSWVFQHHFENRDFRNWLRRAFFQAPGCFASWSQQSTINFLLYHPACPLGPELVVISHLEV